MAGMSFGQGMDERLRLAKRKASVLEYNAETARIEAEKPVPTPHPSGGGGGGTPAPVRPANNFSSLNSAPQPVTNTVPRQETSTYGAGMADVGIQSAGAIPESGEQVQDDDPLRPRINRAKGGMIRDPNGHPQVDTVDAELADGEAVLNAGAAKILGESKIAALNKHGLKLMGVHGMPSPYVEDGVIHAAVGLGGTDRFGNYVVGAVPMSLEESYTARRGQGLVKDTPYGQGRMSAAVQQPVVTPTTPTQKVYQPTITDEQAAMYRGMDDGIKRAPGPVALVPMPAGYTQPQNTDGRATPEQQAALAAMGITSDRVVNHGAGMTLDAARTMQAKSPTNKFYQLSGYGDQNSIYASAGKDGELNVFSGAGTGRASKGMPTPESAQALRDAYTADYMKRMAASTPASAAGWHTADQHVVAAEKVAQDKAEASRINSETRKYVADEANKAKRDTAKMWEPEKDINGNVIGFINKGTTERKPTLEYFANKLRIAHPEVTEEEIAAAYARKYGAK